eukprot:CAMPEP_0195048166 /NCGR_PEP_ID=MMETSP0347-20130606/43820_1 /TAXON_ID=2932 /ORGANISM="Alexandrium fundyense, Strain CCMP1719" /LENGTH=35 /DNA_ID= /DNA_START= /DNA_END= /DNA_ORIENTATION=
MQSLQLDGPTERAIQALAAWCRVAWCSTPARPRAP